ncbi:DUF3060 domain-containing protein [Mycolicibacterium psychrotolerans]|uniref:Membrane protein n=1 Tax=Mycolicibacterium psychrotolerans TaxID=216929 RepID=A0A7I7MI31_9MYCO|nr:DUF3060 domain-containing protein [Mycolicibacterium psychrotolerans]BBX71994.1 membrane protein [Mycolicibacterium psychrotolerans]
MEPTGDPEARIRDLERPLAEQAGATEMGATAPIPPPPYGAPYGMPPTDPYQAASSSQYGSPYYAPPQQVVHKRGQPALWLIPLVVGVAVVAGIVGVVLYFVVGNSSTTGVSGGGGSVAVPTMPSMPTLPSMPALPSMPSIPGVGPTDEVLTVESGGSLSIGGVERKQTVICNQGTVSISGMNNTIEVQGSCAAVTVSGMDNTVTVESAGTIGASGFDNKVTYRSGEPQTSQSGTGNVIERG